MVSKFARFNFSSATAALAAPQDEADRAERELDRLHAELDALKITLAEKEAALAKAALDAQQARDRWQQQLAARIEAAEAQSRQQSARSTLAEVTAACEAAGQTMEQPGQEQARQEYSADSGASAQHASDPTCSAPSAAPQDTQQDSNIIIRTNRIWAAETAAAVESPRRASRRRALGGAVAAASLGLLAIAVVVTGGGSPVRRDSSQDLAVALRDVNVRAAPSTEAKILSTLPRGVKVATIEQRGSWSLIEIEGAGRDTRPRQGWVYNSLLKSETAKTR
jgi:hypothetical protein